MLTTVGLLFTGELLDHVSRWRAMQTIDELIIIIPVVLNLKGNLEMNLSARLGTAANIGELDDPITRRKIILGNLSLLQVQATVVSFVAACVSVIVGSIVQLTASSAIASTPDFDSGNTNSTVFHYARLPHRPMPPHDSKLKSGLTEFTMVASSAMLSTCISSVILGSFMCTLIVLCRRFGRDPDNIAPPIAACLGDLVTLCLIGAVSSVLITFLNTLYPLILGILLILSAIICFIFVRQNTFVRRLVTQGWSPLFGAMLISSGTGMVLDIFASRYEGFPLLAIVISGLPGSVGSILVSRLSTALHAAASTRVSSSRHSKEPSPRLVMLTLLLVTLPIEVAFLSTLRALGWLRLPIIFALFSVVFFCCAVCTSLYLAQFLTNFLWSRKRDPDMYALPIHSALMDLVGQLLLVLCFEIVTALGVY
ncbi:hypothetical protein SERLA73DRAFT_186115 [Serpula lacrymans var. lacrymans S7.3]|uniref:SLC41A/MgtE integral membrane domain-containing protein n=2 Tax=Serpula lacrymans var. lacrymans TaxID=341189 RepID=F8Q5C7_SERL3|nr:uncharacterized protein SERLADRAFT_474997 [Serpula lacrymans var. lacrymans S7.9]EGN96398.1 hypothetical protein SERLA73DRAFT_186115 [Serpula lacrymans var. lacrymans S7.3]EGO21938.1 hypothetical protein SERLADRAFT_474997 [Serpula lacrymans var. lacrymans S7.9]